MEVVGIDQIGPFHQVVEGIDLTYLVKDNRGIIGEEDTYQLEEGIDQVEEIAEVVEDTFPEVEESLAIFC